MRADTLGCAWVLRFSHHPHAAAVHGLYYVIGLGWDRRRGLRAAAPRALPAVPVWKQCGVMADRPVPTPKAEGARRHAARNAAAAADNPGVHRAPFFLRRLARMCVAGSCWPHRLGMVRARPTVTGTVLPSWRGAKQSCEDLGADLDTRSYVRAPPQTRVWACASRRHTTHTHALARSTPPPPRLYPHPCCLHHHLAATATAFNEARCDTALHRAAAHPPVPPPARPPSPAACMPPGPVPRPPSLPRPSRCADFP